MIIYYLYTIIIYLNLRLIKLVWKSTMFVNYWYTIHDYLINNIYSYLNYISNDLVKMILLF